ncbi:MAG: hypothetical protein KGQ87_02970 [Verrucomicrobia bacterium]|nr:hypothetical protein [Verrucomicrobiota bacterium]
MQRWLLIAGAALILFFGIGLPTAYHFYKQSRPHPVWFPIPLNPEAPFGQTEAVIRALTAKLSDRENLLRIGRDLDLQKKWKMDSDVEVADEIGSRLFVKRGDMDTPMGKAPSIHVGFRGTNRDREISYAMLDALLPEVWKVLGIDPPKKP